MSTTEPAAARRSRSTRARCRHLADAQVNVELDTGDMILNLGPQHPATHGTLRLVVRLDGERVIAADPVIGYMHRGYEKLTEFRTYPQITTLINRIDWLSSFANEVPFIDARRAAHGHRGAAARAVHPHDPHRAVSRIATFLLFLGEMGLQVGALTPAFYGFRDREHVLNLIEARDRRALPPQLQPHRRAQGRPAVGLDRRDPLRDEARSSTRATTFEDLVAGNEIFEARTRVDRDHPGRARRGLRRVGLQPARVGRRLGPPPRRQAVPRVPRPRLQGLDPPRRRLVRALLGAAPGDPRVGRMVLQMLDQLPAGPIMAKVPRIIKVPEGEVWVETENPLGQMGYYVVSKGATGPFRVKIRSASFSNVSILPWLLRGVYVPDVDHDPGVALLHPRGHRPMSDSSSTACSRSRVGLGHHARDQDDHRPRDHAGHAR